MKRLTLLLLTLALLAALPARADVRRGDMGEEVLYLQWLLAETGWFTARQDGEFGPKTEEALLNYQRYKGYEASGVADAWLLERLEEDRARQYRDREGEGEPEPYPGDYVPPAPPAAPAHCATIALWNMASRDACGAHAALWDREAALRERGEADEIERMWTGEVTSLCEAWPDASQGARRRAWRAAERAFAAQRVAWGDPARSGEMARGWAEALCEALSGAWPEPGEIPPEPETLLGDYPAACSRREAYAGTAFLGCCAEHAPLMARESRWVWEGASDLEELAGLCADWDAALEALYARWAERADDPDRVRRAHARFVSALSAAEALTGSEDLALRLHLRVVQQEAVRLCAALSE